MFSGIVEDIGKIVALDNQSQALRICVEAKVFEGAREAQDLSIGSSIMISGVCLTAVLFEERGRVWFDVGAETQRRTVMGKLGFGTEVNVERSLKAGARIDGHFVQGHIDSVEKVLRRIDEPQGVEFNFSLSAAIAPFIASKGSVSIDGVSLTVGAVDSDLFSVHIVPHTMAVTTFKSFIEGREVNIETDCIARYTESILRFNSTR